MKLLITGGAGFIGSAVIRQLIAETDTVVINADKLTYAGNLDSLGEARNHRRHQFEHVDICNRPELERVFLSHQPDAVMHLAAESHVDRSIAGPLSFIDANVGGTATLLEVVRSYWSDLPSTKQQRFRLHHVSTDEVYGDLGPNDPAFTEDTPYAPHSPYAASKAAADHLVRAWHHTYGLPVIVTNCSNNYGPYQFPEKLIPVMILNAIEERPLPVYGRGENVRDWLHVDDHAQALRAVLRSGTPGRTYNIGGRAERSNLDVVQALCSHLDDLAPRSQGSYSQLIEFVEDRLGHDRRYAIDDSRLSQELDWRPVHSFERGLKETVRWYLDNSAWVQRVRTGAYRDWMKSNYADRGAAR